jgi:hypothetical protein
LEKESRTDEKAEKKTATNVLMKQESLCWKKRVHHLARKRSLLMYNKNVYFSEIEILLDC